MPTIMLQSKDIDEDRKMDIIDSCFASIKPMQDIVDLEVA